jgi:hypothetical protein
MVFHNGTLVASTEYTVDYETGLFTLDTTFALDYANDTLNITYSYLPFDDCIGKANSQLDPLLRAKYIKEAQAILAELEPSIPLFTYKVNHAYKLNVYTGWVPTLGGVNNYWTFINLQNAVVGDTDVTISCVNNFVTEAGTMNLYVKVMDLNGAAITGSELAFSGEGTFGAPTYDAVGEQYTVPYTAPATAASRTITLSVDAFTKGYTSGSATIDITVHPEIKNLDVVITRGDTQLDSGNFTTISVAVSDKATLLAVSGATVVLTMTPTGLGGYLEEVSGTTNTAGEFVTTFGADNVTIPTTFRISAYVTMTGYIDAEQTTSISVSADPDIVAETVTTDNGFLGLPGPSLASIIAILSMASVSFALYRRKRK